MFLTKQKSHNLYYKYCFSTPHITEKSGTQLYVTLVSQLLHIVYIYFSICLFPTPIEKPRSVQYQGEIRLAALCLFVHACVCTFMCVFLSLRARSYIYKHLGRYFLHSVQPWRNRFFLFLSCWTKNIFVEKYCPAC